MNNSQNTSQRKRVRIVFDETHSQSWSACAERAQLMQPEDPANASYQNAATALAQREFEVLRHLSGPISRALLETTDVLALIHPCDPKWEHTTSQNAPTLSAEEISAVLEFVHGGGALLVVSEYEHDKYGDNLNDLLAPVGLRIESGKIFDRTHCEHENPEWIIGTPSPGSSTLSYLASRACFYRAGWCTTLPVKHAGTAPPQQGPEFGYSAGIAWQTSPQAHPAEAGLIGLAQYGLGRVGLVTDSNLFGDERLLALDHLQLWLNLVYWMALPRFEQRAAAFQETPTSAARMAPARELPQESPQELALQTSGQAASRGVGQLIDSTNALRALQGPNGSVEADLKTSASNLVATLHIQLDQLRPYFTHQTHYFDQLRLDFTAWETGGFEKPDFGEALAAFRPEALRQDGLAHLALFPMYTPNASSQTRFEAVILLAPWPSWLSELERRVYHNPKFVPGHLQAFTKGYESECAVLFPETVSVRTRATNQFGIIFCDREAARLQCYALRAARILGLNVPPELECLLHSMPMLLDTVALWDLIHDASHSLGELPFDPFMIRQRAPFWIYALEELRVDLRSFDEATDLAHNGFPFARHVCWAIVLDRIFRFPITGPRVRNYDALGGQLLFAFLHQRDALIWCDNRLTIRWELLPAAMHALREELTALYKLGAGCSKLTFWIAAHDLISRYLRPNVASKWKTDTRAITDESDPKKWIALVEDDEFPLGTFHVNLLRKIEQSALVL